MNKIPRHKFISMTSAAAVAFASAPIQTIFNKNKTTKRDMMYGLIGKITAKNGQRDKLIEILLEGASDMPGCLIYIVSKDTENEDTIWVTEVWESKKSHRASLELPSVQEAMGKGKPLIENFEDQIEMEPIDGHGLVNN